MTHAARPRRDPERRTSRHDRLPRRIRKRRGSCVHPLLLRSWHVRISGWPSCRWRTRTIPTASRSLSHRVHITAHTDSGQRYRSVSPLCRPARHQRFPGGAKHLRGLEAGGRDGDSADPRTGTPEGKGDQRHAQGNPRHSISAVARGCRFPSRPSARPRDDAAPLPDTPPLRIRLPEVPTDLHANQEYVAKPLLNVSEHPAVSMAPAALIAATRAEVGVWGGILGARTFHGSRPELT